MLSEVMNVGWHAALSCHEKLQQSGMRLDKDTEAGFRLKVHP